MLKLLLVRQRHIHDAEGPGLGDVAVLVLVDLVDVLVAGAILDGDEHASGGVELVDQRLGKAFCRSAHMDRIVRSCADLSVSLPFPF